MALPHSMAGPHDKSAHPDRTYCSKQNEEAAITQLLRMQPDQIRFTWHHVNKIEYSSQGFVPFLHKAEEEPINVERGPTNSKH